MGHQRIMSVGLIVASTIVASLLLVTAVGLILSAVFGAVVGD